MNRTDLNTGKPLEVKSLKIKLLIILLALLFVAAGMCTEIMLLNIDW